VKSVFDVWRGIFTIEQPLGVGFIVGKDRLGLAFGNQPPLSVMKFVQGE
jgi:hypothetical protein